METHEHYTHRLLTEIGAGSQVSQRSLARTLGIALGLTNFLVRRLVRKGWVRMIHIKPNRVSYLLTPTGIAEKARMSRDSLRYSVRLYTEVRNRIREQVADVAAQCRTIDPADDSRTKVVFFGTGEIAEIGYICLQETELHLVGAVGDTRKSRFFDVPVHPVSELNGRQLGGMTFGRLMVMSLDELDRTSMALRSAQVPLDRVHWL